jgi:hypothetical protein
MAGPNTREGASPCTSGALKSVGMWRTLPSDFDHQGHNARSVAVQLAAILLADLAIG